MIYLLSLRGFFLQTSKPGVVDIYAIYHHRTTAILRLFFRDHPAEPVPEESFWTLWCKGRLTEADTLTIRLGATPSRLTTAHLRHPSIFLQAGCPSCRPANSVKALKASYMQFTVDINLAMLVITSRVCMFSMTKSGPFLDREEGCHYINLFRVLHLHGITDSKFQCAL